MELIQIIESTVFFFSLGLLVLLILSYLLFKVKNRSVHFPVESALLNEEPGIIYEKTPEVKAEDEKKIRLKRRFTVVNEAVNEPSGPAKLSRGYEMNSRFYIYKPGRDKIVTNLQLSRIKD
jgi:hypothetical protein